MIWKESFKIFQGSKRKDSTIRKQMRKTNIAIKRVKKPAFSLKVEMEYVPPWNARVWFLAPTCDSSFLPVQTLRHNDDGSRNFMPVTHLGSLDYIPDPESAPATVGIQRENQQMELSVSAPSKKINK